ncbi:MAG TPA: hypothetical protein IAB59_02000 [Candidatus Onthousia faecipullorum]|uniref:Uncharacterized protein n=1 Tax=Candidatus Onthousia faecipullorum TaxID=2840887 RepID=A0A9D1GB14_9FIRM|nr:hypothetical protein [Candidatus Onthousia faecipullorum]
MDIGYIQKKIIYGRPDDAVKIKYLDWLYEFDYNEKPFNNLDDLLEEAVKKVNGKEKFFSKDK